MGIIDILKTSVSNIVSNKIRTLLTMFGIIIGIAAVIAVMAIGEGSTASIESQFAEMGAGNITVSTMNSRSLNEEDRLSVDDYELLKQLEGVKYISQIATYSTNIKLFEPRYNNSASITGVNSDYYNIQSETLLYGRFIQDIDVENATEVVVITNSTAQKVFNEVSQNVINQEISLNTWKGTKKYTVIGIVENDDFETEMLYPDDYTEEMTMPITTLQNFTYDKTLSQIMVTAEVPENSSELSTLITETLDNAHGTSGNYRVQNIMDIMDTMTETLGLVTSLVSAAASISLVVGGVGVMNIMLVTVTERTKEIGIRKALGAKRLNILIQFLVEAIFVTGIGGLLGIALGMYGGDVAGKMLGTGSVVSIEVVIIAFSISTMIGIIFGVYPANKASKLNPVDALRYE